MAYSIEFSRLARYGGEEVSTDAKKQKRFRNGLKPALKYALTHVSMDTFDKLVNTAIKEESGRLAFDESRKHTREVDAPSAPPQKRRLWVPYPAPPGQATQAGYAPRPPTPQLQQRTYQPPPRPAYGGPRPMGPRADPTCYKCGQVGHISTFCPQKLPPPPPRSTSTNAMVRAPAQGRAFNNNTRHGPRAARVNNINVEQAEQATDVVLDADAEQYEQEYEFPLEDRVGSSTSDLTGEPTPSPILHLHALLIYCYPYIAILLCHVSYSTCYLYVRDTPSRPTYCLLFASFASRRRV
nr:uncharacterized protein LOC127307659 [Lolium perenne]